MTQEEFNKLSLAEKLKAHKEGRTPAQTAQAQSEAIIEKPKPVEWIKPEQAPEKIAVLFDDSGSMNGAPILEAQEGTIEFLRFCTMNQTAVNIIPLNGYTLGWNTNLPALVPKIKEISIEGSTPIWYQLRKIIRDATLLPSRIILFSDGAPDYDRAEKETIEALIRARIPVDTVFISMKPDPDADEYQMMKELAEKTGGHFLLYEKGKTTFKKLMKYLAPPQRLALSSPQFREDLQNGKVV